MTNCENKKYACTVCNAFFDRESKYIRHLQTNRHIINQNSNLPCNDVYKAKYMELSEKYYELEQRFTKLEKLLPFALNENRTNCDNVINNTTINMPINLNLGTTNPYGKENWDYIQNDILKLMRNVNTCIPEMLKKIHFDKEHPENHNVKIPNKKLPHLQTFNGEEWQTMNKKEGIENLVVNLVDRLESEYGTDFRESTNEVIKKLWEEKTKPISDDKAINIKLRKQVEYSILDGQSGIKKICSKF
uniref:C2H2-type domain-containing protein n=1 Tax=viral metagenome TaxID=1070528 RepID=A0A6C0L289_9ZZZZ